VFLDPPPAAALSEARTLLADLGAIDGTGRITAVGKALNRLPLPPRLARMVLDAGREGSGRTAAEIAAVLSERGLGGNDVDLRHRLDALRRDRSGRADEARRMARRWAEIARADSSVPGARDDRSDESAGGSIGAILALAYPERLAKNRGAAAGAFLLANGRGANIDPASPLAREPLLAVAEIIGSAAQGRITLAAAIDLADIEVRFADRIEAREEVAVDAGTLALRCRRSRRLGAITLGEQPMPVVPDETTAKRLAAAIAAAGLDRLPWTKALRQWRDRVLFLRGAEGDEWPDLSDAALAASAAEWLAPLLADKTALAALTAAELESALQNMLPYAMRRRLEAEAPTHFDAPSGSRVPIEYDADGPKLAIRVQELFGLDRHPTVARGRVALVIELLSPAHRPVQVTRDLPNFWRGSYAAVRADLRGRYPRHPWPEDPLSAPATRRAKPRGQ
jgi:ATP-dependent helicase HrpB